MTLETKKSHRQIYDVIKQKNLYSNIFNLKGPGRETVSKDIFRNSPPV